MRNSVLVTSDLQSVVLVDNNQGSQRLVIGKRGVLLSVLGKDICATEVPAELDNYINDLLKKVNPFYEFEVADAAKNQLCISYNDSNNTVFIIGITDVVAEHSAPIQIPKEKIAAIAVKMKEKQNEGLVSKKVLLARLETVGASIGGKRFIRFYYLSIT